MEDIKIEEVETVPDEITVDEMENSTDDANEALASAAFGGGMTQEDIEKAYERYKKAHTPYVRETPKVHRNDPCPCGSGLKYKKCCGK